MATTLSTEASPPSETPRWRTVVMCVALAAVTLLIFGQDVTHEFVDYDDSTYVYDNPVVRDGLTWKGVIWAFRGAHADNWHPLTWLSHMLDCQLYDLHPAGHLLTSVLLHAATVVGLFLVWQELTGAYWRSGLVAAIFAAHPLRAESVAWVAERKDVLSGLFFVLTLWAYVRYVRQGGGVLRFGWVMLFFILGLLSKPMVVTLPLILLLLDRWPLQRKEGWGTLMLEKLPLFALSAAMCIVTLWAQQNAIQTGARYAFAARVEYSFVACVIYLRQMAWPFRLGVLYPFPSRHIPTTEVLFAVTLLLGISAIAWRYRVRRPWMWAGWMWYLVMLLPVIGIIQVGNQGHADRYTYLPQIGLYVGITWAAAAWAARLNLGQTLQGLIALGLIVGLAICATVQASYWKNAETLWRHTIDVIPDNEVAYYNLGTIELQKGRLQDAISAYLNAARLAPNYPNVLNNLGNAYLREGKLDEAIAQFRRAVRSQPDYSHGHLNLGDCLLQKGLLAEAAREFDIALRIDPNYAEANFELGEVCLRTNGLDPAIKFLTAAVRKNPSLAAAHLDLGEALMQRGDLAEGVDHLRHAVQISPNSWQSHAALAAALIQVNRMPEAIQQFEEALRLDPADPGIQNNLAWLLSTCPEASSRDGKRAVALARRANAETGSANPVILHTLAAALAESGQFPEAQQTADRAVHLAEAAGEKDLAGQFSGELKRYQAGLPLHP